jgi:hypothetical protein
MKRRAFAILGLALVSSVVLNACSSGTSGDTATPSPTGTATPATTPTETPKP